MISSLFTWVLENNLLHFWFLCFHYGNLDGLPSSCSAFQPGKVTLGHQNSILEQRQHLGNSEADHSSVCCAGDCYPNESEPALNTNSSKNFPQSIRSYQIEPAVTSPASNALSPVRRAEKPCALCLYDGISFQPVFLQVLSSKTPPTHLQKLHIMLYNTS